MLLLNRIPVLDKGFIARLDSSCDGSKLNSIAVEYYKKLNGKFLADTSTLTLFVKCPLFVQLNLSLFNFKLTSVPTQELEVYVPNVTEIGSPRLEVSKNISEDIMKTSEALLFNSKAYQADGCDRFLSQILTPINTYTTLLVHGMYNDWCRFIEQKGAPNCIVAYMNAVGEVLRAEWQ